jgi:hypothetical protein
MVRVCCFCDMVHDEAIGLWQEWSNVVPSTGGTGLAAILSYTCCHRCFEADPGASVFRARQSEPIDSPHSTRVRSARLKWSPAA